MIVQGTRAATGDVSAEWSRLVRDLERFGLLGGPGACDAVARVGADVLDRADVDSAGRSGALRGQDDAP